MNRTIDCIVADWGTTNRRAWALTGAGEIIAERHDGEGLLAVGAGGFAVSFAAFCRDWIAGAGQVPVIMSGMVGSKLGWREIPYLMAPVALSELAQHLVCADDVGGAKIWIVPGVALDDPAQPEVMRGEESQIWGAMLVSGRRDGVFLLPGTHSKWVIVADGRITAFRTYMTGELFGLLRNSGTLSQLMVDDAVDDAAFQRGVQRAAAPDAASLLHNLFGVRSLGLFDRLPRQSLASYMSGLMIGAEMQDALRWLRAAGASGRVMAIGSPALLDSYRSAAMQFGPDIDMLDSADLLPPALLSMARAAGLLRSR